MGKFIKKHLRLAALLEERIARGDYALVGFPGVREIAAEAGVSIMTAHNAVQHLIHKGVVDRRARGRAKAGSRRRSTKGFTIGIVMPPSSTGYLWAWQAEIEAAATACGATVREVICRNWNDALMGEVLRGFDGVFTLQFPDDEVPPHTQELIMTLGTPMVSLGHISRPGISTVVSEEKNTAKQLIAELQKLDHTRFLIVAYDIAGNIPGKIRLQSMREAIAAIPGGVLTDVIKSSPSSDWKNLVVRTVQRPINPPTAIITINEYTALALYRPFATAGIRIPEDISLATCGSSNWIEAFAFPLTSFHVNIREVAESALALLFNKLDHPSGPDTHLLIPQEVYMLESVAKARA